jgi:hypothetical protein
MRKFFSSIMRRRAIKIYAKRLGPLLKSRYGRSRKYTAGQIRQTVTYAGMPLAHICFAYAMYMPQQDFDTLHRELGEACDYQAMRQEIADLHFSGDSTFSVPDLMAQADSFSFGAGDSGGGGAGGGDGGGGSGGGGDGGGTG